MTFLLCDPGWYVQRTSCPEYCIREENTHIPNRQQKDIIEIIAGNFDRGVFRDCVVSIADPLSLSRALDRHHPFSKSCRSRPIMELPMTFGSFTLEETEALRRGYETSSGLLKVRHALTPRFSSLILRTDMYRYNNSSSSRCCYWLIV